MMNLFNAATVVTFAALVQLTTLAVPARADDAVTQTRMVQTGDLDLHTAGGVRVLRHRLAWAARSVCGGTESVGSPGFRDYDRCVTEAEAGARTKADALIASVQNGNRFAMNVPAN